MGELHRAVDTALLLVQRATLPLQPVVVTQEHTAPPPLVGMVHPLPQVAMVPQRLSATIHPQLLVATTPPRPPPTPLHPTV